MDNPQSCRDLTARRAARKYAAGTLSGEEERQFEDHMLGCATCQLEVRLAVGVHQTLDRTAADTPSRSLWRRIPAVAVAAAAALVLLIAWPDRPAEVDEMIHRAPTEDISLVPIPVEPSGRVEEARVFVWHGVYGAERYRVTITDSAGTRLWSEETSDTVVLLSGQISLVPGTLYHWNVEARVDWDRWIPSDFAEFTLMSLGPDGAK